MRYLLVAVVIAAAFFGWKKFGGASAPEPAPVTNDARTPSGNAENRVNGLSGAAPVE